MPVGPVLPLLAAVFVAAVHAVAPRVRAADPIPHRLWLSGAGGVSIAYVFVHVLPELQAGQEAFSETELGVGGLVPYLEHHVYLVALVGFAVYYGVEQIARRGRDERDEGDGDDESVPFRLHLGSFALYNGLIGYFLVHRIESDLVGLAIFTAAMALHAFVTDAGLDRHYDDAYRRYGRWVLAAAVLAGWAIARVVELHELAVATLFGFLAGGIVLNVVKEELPEETRSSFAAFAVGAAGYAVVLLLL
ncbi:hypothetical protein [Candidatus Halobonum tyrrellensis]|uniref:hypothetical protein n=1 Tax=Candidatus Halobonum tyrrellensis TaxID=1431545 RepID=UPI000677958C|nr:hypothetical protein [Candidatus Halobonum tyrrellensis]